MAPLVVVIGDAALDVRVAPAEPVRPGGDVPATIDTLPGGQGANVAVRLARRGVRVRLVTALGTDAVGAGLRDALVAEGVEVRSAPADRSSTVVVVVDPSGERTMLSQRCALFGPGYDPAAVAGADWLVVSGYALLEPGPGTSVGGAVPRRVVLGCSLGAAEVELWASRAAALRPHLLVLNAVEAATVAPGRGDRPDLARRVAERFGAVAVVTRASGAAGVVDGEAVETAVRPGAAVVDTTGAGDAFAAALVGDLVGGAWPPAPDALRRAMLAGHSLATAVTGVIGSQGRVEEEA